MVIPGLQVFTVLLKIEEAEVGECTKADLTPPPRFTEEETEAQ